MTLWPRRQRPRWNSPGESAAVHGAPGEALIEALNDPSRHLGRLLHRRVRLTIDTGGALLAPTGTVHGRGAVAGTLRDLLTRFHDATVGAQQVNGGPGILIRSRGRVVGVIVLAQRGRVIGELWAVVNPDKLRHWNRG